MKKFRIIVICILVLSLLGGTVYAFMVKKTEYTEKNFIPGSVTCEVHEETDTGTTIASRKNSIKVENTGNVDAYVRVKLVSNWVSVGDGSISTVYKESKNPAFALSEGWLTDGNNTYYYTKPISSGDYSPELLASPITLYEEDGYIQVIEIFADAIQSVPVEAVEGSWGVSVDDDGVITSVN